MAFRGQVFPVFLLFLFVPGQCLFGWFETKPEAVKTAEDVPKDFNKDGTAAVVPFEMKTADDEFLNEGKKYGLQLSTLDVCQHKVLLGLQTSCSELSEEELGKLSVRLLNCQSAVEGRLTYPCTDEMSLRQCTQRMDQHTWNTYHLISNRARAVCYNIRQQQFYAKTEMTVNKLVWSTDRQVKAMSQLEQEQQKVSSLTNQTLETVALGQEVLMKQQERLRSSQQGVQNFLAENLKELTLEKALIAAGQKELTRMTSVIREKLDAASTMMLSNEEQRQLNHQELLKDLSTVQDYAKFLQERLNQAAEQANIHQEKTVGRFDDALRSLEKINASIAYLQRVMEATRNDVDTKFGWLIKLLHGTDYQLAAIYCCVLHCGYLLAVMFMATFLKFPMTSRLFLLLMVPMNALSEIRDGSSLGFGPLTILLCIFVSGNVAWHAIGAMYRRRRSCLQTPPAKPPALSPIGYRDTVFSGEVVRDERFAGGPFHSSMAGTPLFDDIRRRFPNQYSEASGARSRSSTPLLVERPATPLGNGGMVDENGTDVSCQSSQSTRADSVFPDVLHTSTPASSRYSSLSRHTTRDDTDAVRRDLLFYLDQGSRRSLPASPARSVSSNLSSSTSHTQHRCQGFNKMGARCKRACLKGKDFCYQHS